MSTPERSRQIASIIQERPKESPLRKATDDLFAELGLDELKKKPSIATASQQDDKKDETKHELPQKTTAVKTEAAGPVSEDSLLCALKPIVHRLLDEKKDVSVKAVRELLEKQFGVPLLDRRAFIKTGVNQSVDDYFRKDNQPLQHEIGTPKKMNQNPGSSSSSSIVSTPKRPRSVSTEVEEFNTQETSGNNTQDSLASGMFATQESTQDPSMPTKKLDTRHDPAAEPTNQKLPLLFSNKIGSYGSNLPVLVELCKPGLAENAQPLNLSGDSGMIGHVTMVPADGTAKPPSPIKKSKRKLTEKQWSEDAARRYQPGSKLQLHLKGDVYQGMMANSSACVIAVTVNPGKEAKVDFVFNHFLQAIYQGNVLESMGGIDPTESQAGDPDTKKSKKN